MKLEVKEVEGSYYIFKTDRVLQSIVGTGTWLTEFIPNFFESRNFIELLLSKLRMLGLCYMISWTLPALKAGWNDRFVQHNHFVHSNNRLHHFESHFRKKWEGTRFYNRFFHIFIQGRFLDL